MSSGYLIYNRAGQVLKLSNNLNSRGGELGVGVLGDLFDFLTEKGNVGEESFYDEGRFEMGFHDANGVEGLARVSISRLDDTDRFLADVKWDEGYGSESMHFLTTISHELRAPLNGIIGFAALMERTTLSVDQQNILKKLQSSNFLLKGLINDLLEFSRVGTAKVELDYEEFDVRLFVEELESLFSERAQKKSLDLISVIGKRLPVMISLPRLRVTQILTNLVSNAIKFTEEGQIILRVAVDVAPDGERWYRFEVEDTGAGIRSADEVLIFEPFGQGASAEETRPEGSGLGLAICKRLAELMEGKMEYRKSKSGGCLFTFSAPERLKNADHLDDEDVETFSISNELKRSKHVLIVEDNQLNSDILSHFLNDYGYSYDIVVNGRKAIEVYEDGKYDIILMDIMLPEVNGYEATEQIMAKKGEGVDIPIIGVTAKVFQDDRKRCLESGMVDVIHKPVDFQLLRRTLERFLFQNEAKEIDEAVDDSLVSPEPGAGEKSGVLGVSVLNDYLSRMSRKPDDGPEVLDNYLNAIQDGLNELETAINTGGDVERFAHSLKGNLGLIGAWDMQVLAKGMELAASKQVEFRPAHWLLLLNASFVELKKRIEDELPSGFDVR